MNGTEGTAPALSQILGSAPDYYDSVWNSLPDSLRDPAVESDRFRRDLKTHLFPSNIRDMSALEVSPFHAIAIYKSTPIHILTNLPTNA